VIATPEVNFREDLGPIQLIKHIIQPRNRDSILDGDVVYGPRINTHTPSAVLLRYQKGSNQTWTIAFPNVPTIKQLLDLSLKLFRLIRIAPIC